MAKISVSPTVTSIWIYAKIHLQKYRVYDVPLTLSCRTTYMYVVPHR